jgi:hypothetical protein
MAHETGISLAQEAFRSANGAPLVFMLCVYTSLILSSKLKLLVVWEVEPGRLSVRLPHQTRT